MEKQKLQNIKIASYNYDLPDGRIAKYPLSKRDESKLLIYKSGEISNSQFKNISDFLPSNSILYFNNTKVIHARLFFYKPTGARIEVFCLEPHDPSNYQENFTQTQSCSWKCLIGNARKWKEGQIYAKIQLGDKELVVCASRLTTEGETSIIQFDWDNSALRFSDILEKMGELPIPPYLNRNTEDSDLDSYQTVYSKVEGSVAAPTAGLHFTKEVLAKVESKRIIFKELTLHVGAGTFRPVKTSDIGAHEMHAELFSVDRDLIESIINNKGKNIAVGTTSVRTLESLYYLGEILTSKPDKSKILVVEQWQAYDSAFNKLSVEESMKSILSYLDRENIGELSASTRIIIAPGYKFKIVDGIITNFHQPQSTLLLLVSAFVGNDKWKDIYKYALDNDYRFLSYGDSSFLQH